MRISHFCNFLWYSGLKGKIRKNPFLTNYFLKDINFEIRGLWQFSQEWFNKNHLVNLDMIKICLPRYSFMRTVKTIYIAPRLQWFFPSSSSSSYPWLPARPYHNRFGKQLFLNYVCTVKAWAKPCTTNVYWLPVIETVLGHQNLLLLLTTDSFLFMCLSFSLGNFQCSKLT